MIWRLAHGVLLGSLLLPCAGCRRQAPARKAGYATARLEAHAVKLRSLELNSSWIGLGIPVTSTATLKPDSTRYSGTWRHGRGTREEPALLDARTQALYSVPASAIMPLWKALIEPCVPQPTLAAFGITPQSLRDHAVTVQQSLHSDFDYRNAAPAKRAGFVHEFTNTARAQENLQRLFKDQHTDDYPSVEITVTYENGLVLKAETHSQSIMMLPWTVTVGTKHCASYASAIPLAVQALMPQDMVNRSRLNSDYLYSELAAQALFAMKQRQ